MSDSTDYFTTSIDLEKTFVMRKDLAILNIAYLNAMKDVSENYLANLALWSDYLTQIKSLESSGDLSTLMLIEIPDLVI